MIRVVIADCEPLVRAHIARLLESRSEFKLVGQFGNAEEAYRAVLDLSPELIFLDLELSDLERFDTRVLHAPERAPALILTSAQPESCPQTLHLYALDHLLKPFDGERFEKVLARAVAYLGRESTRSLRSQHLRLLRAFPESARNRGPHFDQGAAPRRYLDRVLVREGDRIFFLKVEDIDRIEAAGGHSRVHAGGLSYLLAEGIDPLAERLDPHQFLSIRRSLIVNLDRLNRSQLPRRARSS